MDQVDERGQVEETMHRSEAGVQGSPHTGEKDAVPSPTCVVVPPAARPWWEEPDLEYRRCGQPVVGERGDWPMCAEHFAIFDPALTGSLGEAE